MEIDYTYLLTICRLHPFPSSCILCTFLLGSSVDMWAVGIMTYLLLGGILPFHDKRGRKQLFNKILHQEVEMNDLVWENISSEAKNFIAHCLKKKPKDRLTAIHALDHPWLTKDRVGSDAPLLETQKLLRIYNLKRKLRSAVYTVIFTNKFTSLGFTINMDLKALTDDNDTEPK